MTDTQPSPTATRIRLERGMLLLGGDPLRVAYVQAAGPNGATIIGPDRMATLVDRPPFPADWVVLDNAKVARHLQGLPVDAFAVEDGGS